MKAKGGVLLAISADEIEDLRRLADEQGLPYRFLSCAGIPVLADYGVEHLGGGPGGRTIAVPTKLLIDSGGEVIWRHSATRITDRPPPEEVLAAIAGLDAAAPR